MGGIHLTSPDYPGGFPINTQQLHYLVVNGHVDMPDMDAMDISERNSVDTLSRLASFPPSLLLSFLLLIAVLGI